LITLPAFVFSYGSDSDESRSQEDSGGSCGKEGIVKGVHSIDRAKCGVQDVPCNEEEDFFSCCEDSSSDGELFHGNEHSNSSESEVEELRPLEFYEENMKTPYFWKGKRDFQLDEVLDILHLSVDGNRICLERPLGVNEDASFVFDTRKLQARRDYLEDNIGGYRNQGHCGKIFTVKTDRIVDAYAMERTLQERPPLGPDQYLVKVVYWSHKKHKDFKRRTFEVSSSRGEGVFVLVQYLFEAEAHEVSPCKKMRTSEGTKQKIRDRVGSHKTPSALYDELFDEVGGMDFKCASNLPRSTVLTK